MRLQRIRYVGKPQEGKPSNIARLTGYARIGTQPPTTEFLCTHEFVYDGWKRPTMRTQQRKRAKIIFLDLLWVMKPIYWEVNFRSSRNDCPLLSSSREGADTNNLSTFLSMSEVDSALEVPAVSSDPDNEQTPNSNVTDACVSLPRHTVQYSRRHSTQMSSGTVYPIAEGTIEATNRSVGTGRRRSVSTRGITGTPANAPAAWSTFSSSLRRSVSDIRGHADILNRTTLNPSKETPYEEMMVRFQIRQLQQPASSTTNGLEGQCVGSSPVVTAHSPRPDHYLRPRHSSRDISDHVSSIPDFGSRTGSFLNFGDRSGGPPLQSGTSSAQLTEQHKLAYGDLPVRDPEVNNFFILVQKTLQAWKCKLLKPISPYSRVFQARYAVILAATAIYLIWFPVELAFPDQHAHLEATIGVFVGLDVLISLRTSYVTETGTIVASASGIFWHYAKTRFVVDFLVALSLLLDATTKHLYAKWMSFVLGVLSVGRLTFVMRFVRLIWLIRANQSGSANNFWAWLLYSRYSHLFRIAGIVVMILCIAHYIACIWTILLDEGDAFEDTTVSWHDKYSESFYAALLLMQGEGVPAETAAQNFFASLSVVLGSIVLALVFGHVAILVSNFNANTTSYQRKMEEVFAMTAKLQLPVPLRERIREYYEHLWHEYECLDGEIVQFSKGLSHSLGLEVVLFKYMEVVMHVPFWKDCTPDFQKQIMLHLDVRVYLPNDFIMREGEVDVEFYMVNRGYCELDRDVNQFERVTTTTLAAGRKLGRTNSDLTARRRSVAVNGSEMDDGHRSAYELDATQQKYYRNGGRDGQGKEILVSRGQAFGDMALLMNYLRAANVRAITHVEMCVLSRESFQSVLAKYPDDRHRVIVDMLASYMQSYEMTQSRCPMLELARTVYSPEAIGKVCAKTGALAPAVSSTLTVRQAAERIYTAINMESTDATLKFGVGLNIREKLIELRQRRSKKQEQKTQSKKTLETCISTTKSAVLNNDNKKIHLDGNGNNDNGGIVYSEEPPRVTNQASKDHERCEAPCTSLQERLQQLEEREGAILQGLKKFQTSFKHLQNRQPTVPHSTHKRAEDSSMGNGIGLNRIPLLRRVGSFVGATSGSNVDSKIQEQNPKKSPTRYADKLFNLQVPSPQKSHDRKQEAPCHQLMHQISKPNDSFRFTSEIEPSVASSPPEQQPAQSVVFSSTNSTTRTLDQKLPTFRASFENAPVERNPRMLFQHMASRSLRVLEQAVQSRTDSSVLGAKIPRAEQMRRKTFRRTYSQLLRTEADIAATDRRPRSSLTLAQSRVLKHMSSLVSDTSGNCQQNSKSSSPTRYADELFRRRPQEPPKGEGWESK